MKITRLSAGIPRPNGPTHTAEIMSRLTPLFQKRVDSWFVAGGSVAWFIWEDGNEYEVTVSPSRLGRHLDIREEKEGQGTPS